MGGTQSYSADGTGAAAEADAAAAAAAGVVAVGEATELDPPTGNNRGRREGGTTATTTTTTTGTVPVDGDDEESNPRPGRTAADTAGGFSAAADGTDGPTPSGAFRECLEYEAMDIPDLDPNGGGSRDEETDGAGGSGAEHAKNGGVGAVIHRRRRNTTIASNFTADPLLDKSYHPGAFTCYHPPVQRQRWGQTQVLPRINWGDLFFDLFYVGAAYKTSNILVDTPSATGVLYFLGCFLSIMQLWLNKTFFDARFVNSGDDLYHRVWEILYLSALASAILHIQPVAVMSDTFASADMFAFALSLAVAQLLFVVRFVDLACFGRGQRDVLKVLAWREGSMMCVAMLVQAVAATLAGVDYFGPQGAGGNGGGGEYGTNSTGEYDGGGGGHRWLAASASAGADHSSEQSSNTTTPYADDHADEAATNTVPIWLCLLVPVLFWLSWVFQTFILFPRDGYTHKKLMVPLNVDFVIHRDGEWIMLMYGESILSLLTVDIPEETSPYYLTFYFGLSTVILLQYLHFRSQPHDADDHVLRRSKDRSLVWKVFFSCYSASLIALGSAFTLFVSSFSYSSASSESESAPSENQTVDDDNHRMRHLAGGGGGMTYPPDDMVQRAAYLFSASLALVFLCLDVMSLMHIGFEQSQRRCYCKKTRAANTNGIILIVVRSGLIVFCATLGVWCGGDVEVLSGLGLAVTVIQLGMRRLGHTYLSEEAEHLDATEVPVSSEGEGGHQDNGKAVSADVTQNAASSGDDHEGN